jgi:hypothetical protein
MTSVTERTNFDNDVDSRKQKENEQLDGIG